MENKLISIITPTFNSSKYIEETIKSVQNQTYKNWELLITDDSSNDDTCEIVERFSQKDKRITLYQLKKNSGPAVARNNSIQKAKGHYLAFLDADDIWFEFHLKNSIEAIKSYNCDFVFSSYKRSNENLELIHSDFIVPERVTYHDILKTNSISCLTAFIKIDVLGKKYMPNIRKRQDMGLWLNYLRATPFAYGIKECHAIYRMRDNSLSRNKSKLITYQWKFYRDVENIGFLKSIYYLIWWMYLGYKKYN